MRDDEFPRVTRMRRAEVDHDFPGLLTRLGMVPDATLASEYNMSRARICQIRQEFQIPAAGVRTTPTESEWAHFLRLEGDITISTDRRSVSVNGVTHEGRTLRQAVAKALKVP